MKLAIPNEQDLNGAMEVARILDDLANGFFPDTDTEIAEHFDITDPADCRKAVDILLEISIHCSLMRAAMTTVVLCDPTNKVIDHSIDHVDHHPEVKAAVELKTKIDSFFTQKFSAGMKFKNRHGDIYDIAAIHAQEGLIAFTDETDEDLQWVRWENITLIENQEAA